MVQSDIHGRGTGDEDAVAPDALAARALTGGCLTLTSNSLTQLDSTAAAARLGRARWLSPSLSPSLTDLKSTRAGEETVRPNECLNG